MAVTFEIEDAPQVWHGKDTTRKITINNNTKHQLEQITWHSTPPLKATTPHIIPPNSQGTITVTLPGTKLFDDEITQIDWHIDYAEKILSRTPDKKQHD